MIRISRQSFEDWLEMEKPEEIEAETEGEIEYVWNSRRRNTCGCLHFRTTFHSFSAWHERADGISVPFLLQQKVPDIAVLDPVAAHIKFIQCDDILGKVVADTVIDTKLPLNGIFRGQQVSHLDI